MVQGKRLVVVDDSIVRGNTQRAQVRMLREAGAREVHVRIGSPPVKWPCFFGIDFASRAELIANGMTVDEICRSIGADSVGYISLEGLVEATNVPGDNLCRACFDGVYPVELPAANLLGKHLLETPLDGARPRARPAPPVPSPSLTERSLPMPTEPPGGRPGAYAAAGVSPRCRAAST